MNKYPIIYFPIGLAIAVFAMDFQEKNSKNLFFLILSGVFIFLGGALIVYSVGEYSEAAMSERLRRLESKKTKNDKG